MEKKKIGEKNDDQILTMPARQEQWSGLYIAPEVVREKRAMRGILGLVIFIVIILGLGGARLAGLRLPFMVRSVTRESTDTGEMSGGSALQIAESEAKKWRGDAALAFMNSGAVKDSGNSEVWKFIFVSRMPEAKGRGYVVEIAGGSARFAEEIPYEGPGADFPGDAMSTADAIKRTREISGYETAVVTSVEAVYGPDGKQWYWGIKTDRGVISIRAK